MIIEIAVMRIVGSDTAVPLPSYESLGAAGADLRANFPAGDREMGRAIAPMERLLVPTGLRLELPQGFEMQLRPRSGLALKQGLTLLNTPGTIDSDYRGEIGVLMINLSNQTATIRHGDRIAQAVIAPVTQAKFTLTETLSDTSRGAGGFGSTGVT